jgi:hypothetical protein
MSLTALSLFIWQKEIERRETTEVSLKESQEMALNLEGTVKELKKQNFLLEEKSKETDERINSLMDELELEEGLKEEMKTELAGLKIQIEDLDKVKTKLEQQLSENQSQFDLKVADFEKRIQEELKKNEEMQKINKELEAKKAEIEKMSSSSAGAVKTPSKSSGGFELDPIVVSPGQPAQVAQTIQPEETSTRNRDGRVLSVDVETEFVIINLGEKDGVQMGQILSLFRGKEYLGDIKVTRVQPEMAAADLIPPLSSRTVRKSDQVSKKTE